MKNIKNFKKELKLENKLMLKLINLMNHIKKKEKKIILFLLFME